MLEAVEAAFDAVALFIELAVIAARQFPVPSGRDDGHGSEAFDLADDLRGVIALIGDDSFGPLALQQPDRLGILGGLAGSDAEGDRQAIFVGQQMDFGAQTSSGTPQSRVFGDPFLRPAAACWCARTMVESSIR